MADWQSGDPLEPPFMLGSIINRQQYEKILRDIDIGKEGGATLIQCGTAISLNNDYFIEPTIFDNVSPMMTIATEAIFGPVFSLSEENSDDEAIAIANDTCYSLQASLYTRDLKKAHIYSQGLKAGRVSVNCFSEGDITTPFGG